MTQVVKQTAYDRDAFKLLFHDAAHGCGKRVEYGVRYLQWENMTWVKKANSGRKGECKDLSEVCSGTKEVHTLHFMHIKEYTKCSSICNIQSFI